MLRYLYKYIILLVLIVLTHTGFSQFGGNNIFELQAGNLPYSDPSFLVSNYNQLNLNYRFRGFKASGRAEYFVNQYRNRRYVDLSQFKFQYSNNQFNIKLGHYYEMLGNGLLLRAFEIPASIYEDMAYRVRHGFYRDLAGISAGYTGEWFHMKALYGKPLLNVLPPTVDRKERRIDELYAVNPGFSFGGQSLDISYMLNTTLDKTEHFGSVRIAGNLPHDFAYNTELAAQMGTGEGLFTSAGSNHAFYASLSWSGMSAGGSLEWKEYSNFFLGSGFSDPPTLVKEHSYKVLNRSTHVTNLNNEKGFQLEAYYRFEGGQMLTLNTSRARNNFTEVYIFSEYFAEIFTPLGESASIKVFLDYSRDPFNQETDRIATGSVFETLMVNRWSALLEMEYQYFYRSGFSSGDVHNAVIIAGISKGPRFSASLTWELSTDIYQTDKPTTLFDVETNARHWFGMDLKYRINTNHTLTFFAGQRRGGPACTSGICYEVLDYQGFEFRITTRF